MKKHLKSLTICFIAVFALAAIAWAGTISKQPYGISTPAWYGYSNGAAASYYLAAPTLSANDTACGIAATQTLTNKTISSASNTITVARSSLSEDALKAYGIAINQIMAADGAPLGVSETGGDHFLALGTNTIQLQGETANNETEASVSYIQFMPIRLAQNPRTPQVDLANTLPS